MKRDDLIYVAKELNELLSPEPSIPSNTRVKVDVLMPNIKEAAELLEDSDKLTEKTFNILLELECDIPAKVKVLKPEKKKKTATKKQPKNNQQDATNKYGFRNNSASGVTSELIMGGEDKEKAIKIIAKKFSKTEEIAKGRYYKVERELKKRGFIK